jgi:hypothetical protein
VKRASRREFVKLSAATAAAVVLPCPAAEAGQSAGADGIPPHRAQIVPGVHGYADAISVRAGGTIRFHLSHDVPCAAAIHRLGHDIDSPVGDPLLHEFPEQAPRGQPIHPGSYVWIRKSLSRRLNAFTVEAWVRPWSLKSLQGVVTQEDKESDTGFALGIGPDGYVGFFLGNGVGPDDAVIHRTAPGSVTRGRWHHLVAVWDGRRKSVWLDGRLAGEWDFAGPVDLGTHPLRLGAMGQNGEAVRFLDGDLAMVSLYGRALQPAEISRRTADRGLGRPPRNRGLLAVWDFAEERGHRVGDQSGRGRYGRIINHGTWMVGGPSFVAGVPRFEGYDPARDPVRGHALRLASDDLYDCRWSASLSWRVPPDVQPGIHVLRLRSVVQGRERLAHVTFIVRRPRHRPAAPILVICSTNTWLAYNAAPFGVWPDGLHAVVGTDGLPNAAGEPPAFSFYRRHAAGQGTYQMGLRMPWPAAGPYVLYGGPTRYSHLMRAERFLHVWLERSGYEFDLVSDLDVDRDPGLLRRHRCVLLNGHSEYWSVPALRGLETYLRRGGNLCVFSGNTLFWRVSFDDTGTVMEGRKVDAPGDQLPPERRGECWHSHDGLRGGLLRDCGFPGWRLIGLETLGWNDQSKASNFGPYRVTNADHFLFHQPQETGLRAGDSFGHGPDGGLPLANGHEFDVRLSTLRRLQAEPDPPGGHVPDDPPGIVPIANGVIPWREGGAAFDFFFRGIKPGTDQGGEMIYWERPDGGRVFHAGSIGSGWALHGDPRFQTLVQNVLHHFGVSPHR